MLEKYRATIHGDRIEWEGEAPKDLNKTESIKVDVTVVSAKPKLKKPNGEKLAAILRKIADQGGIPGIDDAVKWQRSIRKDRPMPGRK